MGGGETWLERSGRRFTFSRLQSSDRRRKSKGEHRSTISCAGRIIRLFRVQLASCLTDFVASRSTVPYWCMVGAIRPWTISLPFTVAGQ